MNVAETILSQLGGSGRIRAMVGAHTLVNEGDALSFQIKARAQNGIKKIKIRLAPSDTYVVSFMTVRKGDVKVVSEVEDVYVDSLKRVLETTTGLYFSL